MASVTYQIREAINQVKVLEDENKFSSILENLDNTFVAISDFKIINRENIEHIIYLISRYLCSNGFVSSISPEYGSDKFMKDIKNIKDPILYEVMETLISMLKYTKEV